MALPRVVYSGDAEACGPPMKAPNGKVYVACTSTLAFRVLSSADPTTISFVEQDPTNRPTNPGGVGAIDYMHACQYEHLIFFAYGALNGSEHDILLKVFDTTGPETWVSGNETVYSGGGGQVPTAWLPSALVATPNYLYCLHPSDDEREMGSPYDRCMVSYRNLDGTTWNNSVEIEANEVADVQATSLAVNEDENAVCVYVRILTVKGIAWDRSTFGAAVSAVTTVDVPRPMSQAVSYMDGSTNRIIARFDTSGSTRVWRITSTGTTIVNVGASSIEVGVTPGRGGLARWGETLYGWYQNSSNNPAYEVSVNHGLGWSGAEHSDPSNNLTEHPWANAYCREGQLKIAIVYKEGTTQLSYDERTISNVSAPDFEYARTPVRQNRIYVSA